MRRFLKRLSSLTCQSIHHRKRGHDRSSFFSVIAFILCFFFFSVFAYGVQRSDRIFTRPPQYTLSPRIRGQLSIPTWVDLFCILVALIRGLILWIYALSRSTSVAIILHLDKFSSSSSSSSSWLPCSRSSIWGAFCLSCVVFRPHSDISGRLGGFLFYPLVISTIFPNESSLAIRISGIIFFNHVLDHVFVKEFGLWFCYDMGGCFTEYLQNGNIILDDITTDLYFEMKQLVDILCGD